MHDSTVQLNRDGTTVTISGLPTPSTCTVAELDTDGGRVSYNPAPTVAITGGAATSLQVVNEFPNVVVHKEVSDLVETSIGQYVATY
ncbi:MAG TPA: DUF5979 domain-containing protein, partial [Ilumatobacteraceae bacterium]|nr:DUF5979 domain-containing protein [Ilumatobacteraceae bacterium]